MNLVRLIYASRMAYGCGPDNIEDILKISRKSNRERNITGALCYSVKGFLQCLEGPASVVNELYRKIVQDERHEKVNLLEYSDITERDFGHWSMAYIRADEVDRKILQKHRGKDLFDPFDLVGGEALDFLKEVSAERADFLAKQQALAG